jgi:hypothetical protein
VTSAGLPLSASTPVEPGGWRATVARRVSLKILAASLVLGFLIGTLLTVVAWTSFGVDQVAPPKDVELVIPRGTAEDIALGRPARLPSEVRLVSGDRLVLENQDIVVHTLGGWQVNPGQSLTIVAEAAAANVFACTIHPSGTLGLIITARPGLIDAILVVIMASVPIGLVLFAGWTVFRMLDTDDSDYEKAA